MNYDFYFNNKDINGLVIGQGSIDQLHAPISRKEYITNECALVDGTQYLIDIRFLPRVQARDINLNVYLMANNVNEFYDRYTELTDILNDGAVTLTEVVTDDNGDDAMSVVYHLIFKSCTTYQEFNGRMAKMQLRFIEPNPNEREIER